MVFRLIHAGVLATIGLAAMTGPQAGAASATPDAGAAAAVVAQAAGQQAVKRVMAPPRPNAGVNVVVQPGEECVDRKVKKKAGPAHNQAASCNHKERGHGLRKKR
jgi:hypothetical protein